MKKLVKVLFLSIIFALIITVKSYAGSFSISTSANTVEPNSTVTISITGNNATGRINLSGTNIKLSSSSVWVENNTQTITCTITGGDGQNATITAIPATDNLVDSTTGDTITGSKSASISIKKKEVVAENKSQSSSASEPAKAQTANNTVNSTKKNTSVEKNNNKQTSNLEDQGTKAEFGISSLYLFAVNVDGEKSEIVCTPKFDINIGDYSCNVESNIKLIEVEYDANEYKDLVQIEGADKELVPGENIISISMKNSDGKEKFYKIVVNKQVNEEEQVDQEQNIVENENNKNYSDTKKEPIYVKMPLIWFITMILGIILVEGAVFIIIIKKMKKK